MSSRLRRVAGRIKRLLIRRLPIKRMKSAFSPQRVAEGFYSSAAVSVVGALPILQKLARISPAAGRMLVIGDSHSQFWSGQNALNAGDLISGVSTVHVGAALAYTLMRDGKIHRAADRVIPVLNSAEHSGVFPCYLMFSFGEIDIRAHIIKRAAQDNRSVAEVVEGVVQNYVAFLREMRRYGQPILAWGPPATQVGGARFNAAQPTIGTESERNGTTALFNARMRELGDGLFTYVSVLDQTLLMDGKTNRAFLYDGTHLGQMAMPIALAALERETGWAPNVDGTVNLGGLLKPPTIRNLAPDAASCRLTSKHDGTASNLTAADPVERVPVVFGTGTTGSVLIDLGALLFIESIKVEVGGDASVLEIWVSTDLRNFVPAMSMMGAELLYTGAAILINIDQTFIRGLRILVKQEGNLTIHGVEIYGSSFL